MDDAGEALTVQRAAFVTEARARHDHELHALTRTLEALCRVHLAKTLVKTRPGGH